MKRALAWVRWLNVDTGSRRHDVALIIAAMVVTCVPVALVLAGVL